MNSNQLKQSLHEVFYGNDVFPEIQSLIPENRFSSIFYLYDSNSFQFCSSIVKENLSDKFHGQELVVPAGEQSKSLNTIEFLIGRLLDAGADRDSLIINVGGGVITDLGGFCAAVFKRGINYINLPTSLMAMVDAAIGGKTAVNVFNYKNQIGNYHFPLAVGIYQPFLNTLPLEETYSGFGEIIKYALVFDEQLFMDLYNWQGFNVAHLSSDIIEKCISYKISVVENDPYEMAARKLLNAGHTMGHALESLAMFNNEKLSHGEAVAKGLLLESYIARELKILEAPYYEKIKSFIEKFFGSVILSRENIPLLMNFLLADKKNKNKGIGFTLLKNIGHADFNILLDSVIVNDILTRYCHEKN